MKYFDILFTLHDMESPADAMYRVVTVSAETQELAEAIGRREARKLWKSGSGWLASQRFWRAAPSGDMDMFIGRYVGEFIDEARAGRK